MTLSVRRNQLSILGIIAGVAVIPIGLLGLLFLAAKLVH
jgi:hypothetical protein